MTENLKNQSVRTYRSKTMVFVRIIDIFIIALTLYNLLLYYQMEFAAYQVWWLLISLVALEFFAEFNLLYHLPRGSSLLRECFGIVISWLGVVVILFCVARFYPHFVGAYSHLYKVWLVCVPLELLAWHVLFRTVINYYRTLGGNTRRVAIVGITAIGEKIEKVITQEKWMGLNFQGYYDDRIKADNKRHHKEVKSTVRGNVEALIKKVKNREIDIIYITLPLKAEERIKRILADFSDTTVTAYYVPDLFVFDLLRSKMEDFHGIPIISIYDTPFYGIDSLVKRLFDIVVSILILTIIAIPLLLIAIGVKLSSPGPVLFIQTRYGLAGEPINVWKFRSMSVCENGDKVVQATENDSRVTRFGKFIRKNSLDELPQFINVLQGRMSIIGPRPHAVTHNEFYRGKINGYMLRHTVKPGITGLAQINGCRGETETLEKMEARIKYDLQYITIWSLYLDIKILLATVFNGFRSDQSY